MPYTVKELDSKSALSARKIIYPSSDGKPMAENIQHFKWIATIEGGLETFLCY